MARRRGEFDRGKERFWREMVRRWRGSGGTIRAFCDEHDLSEPSFYSWRREIARRDGQTGECPSRTGAPRHASEVPAFVPVRVMSAEPASVIEVVVGAGHVVRVAPGFDAATLRSLLVILTEDSAC